MTYRPTPDQPMRDAEVVRAEEMMARYEITQSDLSWLLGLEDGEEDRAPPRGFKSRQHFEAFLWHKERARRGLPKLKRRRRAA